MQASRAVAVIMRVDAALIGRLGFLNLAICASWLGQNAFETWPGGVSFGASRQFLQTELAVMYTLMI